MILVLTRRLSKTVRLVIFTILCCILFLTANHIIKSGILTDSWDFIPSHLTGDKSGIPQEPAKPDAYAIHEDQRPLSDDLKYERQVKLHKYFEKVFQHIKEFSPVGRSSKKYGKGCRLDENVVGRPDSVDRWDLLTTKNLGQCLEISKSDRDMLKKKHNSYVNAISLLSLPKGAYQGRGIVTVGGGQFSVLSLVMIKMLRKLGTTLPVEVLIPPGEEGDEQLCKQVFPELNAKCISLSDVLPASVISNFAFKGYQLKSLAIIASSFQDLLLLDADNIPVVPLDNIFDAEPYKFTKLVLWPDFWRRTTSPIYYEVADIPVGPERVRNCMDDFTPPSVYTESSDLDKVPLHDLQGTVPDVSTESGQILINKYYHLPTVLLSLYYNVNGPTWYYPMFSQKAAGEGDKETFIASANFYELKYYQVKSIPGVEGYRIDGNPSNFRGVAILQHDFREDYKGYMKAQTHAKEKYLESATLDPDYSLEKLYKQYFGNGKGDDIPFMFAHCNFPKFEPWVLSARDDLIENGHHIRSFTSLDKLQNFDLELEAFDILNKYICQEMVEFQYYKNLSVEERTKMCQYVKDRLRFLKETHESATNAVDKDNR
ncbi:HHR080Cp [Eremothecium sinecaudum]|uniref:HHR080Cp n=1 Tax=Eremothecium sinecaudum TaxID=45286 RepID=A0A0X8HWL9_9SACH|nr:HHR080Cp [Eremothecium sinecaudum]AMD22849.1 HHR080Cp [Eremothecium sinecaudum]